MQVFFFGVCCRWRCSVWDGHLKKRNQREERLITWYLCASGLACRNQCCEPSPLALSSCWVLRNHGDKWLKVCPVGLLEPWKLTWEPVELFLFRFQGSHQLYLLKSQSKGKILYCKCPDVLPINRKRLINKSAIRDSLLIDQSTLFQLIPLMQSAWFTCKLICTQVRKCSYLYVHVFSHPKQLLDLFF